MAKILYAGTASDFVVTTVTVPASAGGTVDVLKLNPGASLEAWGAGSGGSQITDIALFTGSYTTAGSAAPSGIFPAETSSTFLFWAEDTLDAVYVTGQGQGVLGGQRWLARPVNDVARLRVLEALDPIGSAEKAAALGVASLDATGKVPSAQLPSSGVSGVIDITTAAGGTDSGNVTITAADLNAVPTSLTVSAGTAMSGGGDLTTNRTLGVVLGTTAGTAAEGNHTHGGFTTSPRPVKMQILTADAPTEWKTAAAADPYTLVLTGTNDGVIMNQATDLAAPLQSRNAGMPAGAKQLGMVEISGGRVNVGTTQIKMRTGVHLKGQGRLTEIRAVTCNQPGVITLANVNDHLCELSDFWLNGNSSSGGTCSGINFDMTGSGSTSLYPDSNPDSDHHIHDLYITGFNSSTSRHAVYLHAGSGDNNRGNIIYGLQIRGTYTGGSGIWLQAASDSFISDCHIGGMNYGYRIDTGNTKISNSKSFYSQTAGFYFTSGRGALTGLEAQDDEVGFYFDGSPYTAAGLVADSCNQAGFRVSTSELIIAGLSAFNRGGVGSGIRFETSQRGVWYDGTYNNINLVGNVKAANTTTPISGTTPTASFLDGLLLI
jgi:hypothetical protein